MPTRDPADAAPVRWMLAFGAALAGVLGMSALWTVWNAWTGAINGWVSLVCAVDFALLLRLAGAPAGNRRAGLATAATFATIALVLFLTAATRMGYAMGLRPFESASRLGLGLAWTLTESVATSWDVAGLVAGLALAWWLSR